MLLRTSSCITLMTVGLVAGLISFPAAPVQAQVVAGVPRVAGPRVFGPVGVGLGAAGRWGYGNNWGWVHGAGGYPLHSPAQDAAVLMDAVSTARIVESRVELNDAVAQRQYIENVREWNQFYNDRRDAYKARQAAESEKEKQAVQNYIATRQSQKPPRLTSAQLDAYAGVLHWPDALLKIEFTTQRAKLENLFATRANAGSTPALADAIRFAARNLQADLRDRIREYDTNPNEYLAARKFLESLALEGEYPLE